MALGAVDLQVRSRARLDRIAAERIGKRLDLGHVAEHAGLDERSEAVVELRRKLTASVSK